MIKFKLASTATDLEPWNLTMGNCSAIPTLLTCKLSETQE